MRAPFLQGRRAQQTLGIVREKRVTWAKEVAARLGISSNNANAVLAQLVKLKALEYMVAEGGRREYTLPNSLGPNSVFELAIKPLRIRIIKDQALPRKIREEDEDE